MGRHITSGERWQVWFILVNSIRSRGSLNESIHDLFKWIISLNTAAHNNVFIVDMLNLTVSSVSESLWPNHEKESIRN